MASSPVTLSPATNGLSPVLKLIVIAALTWSVCGAEAIANPPKNTAAGGKPNAVQRLLNRLKKGTTSPSAHKTPPKTPPKPAFLKNWKPPSTGARGRASSTIVNHPSPSAVAKVPRPVVSNVNQIYTKIPAHMFKRNAGTKIADASQKRANARADMIQRGKLGTKDPGDARANLPRPELKQPVPDIHARREMFYLKKAFARIDKTMTRIEKTHVQ